MKILIPVLSFGPTGGNRVLSKLADELITHGNSVVFLCPNGSINPYFPTNASVLWIDNNGNLLLEKNDSEKKLNAFSIQRKLIKALRKIPKESFDVIIANHSLTTISIYINNLRKRSVYYVQAYEPDYYNLMGGLGNKILGFISSLSYLMRFYTIVNSPIYLKYKRLKANKILYPGIDFTTFFPKKNNLEKRDIIIGTVGRSEKYKGTSFILDAFQKLRCNNKNIQLHVCYGNALDFKDHPGIHCFQPDNDKELANFYRTLDFYISAGFTQLGGFHYPVVEAMSCGVSVLTTPYFPSNKGNSWQLVPNQSESIVVAFNEAVNNPDLTLEKINQGLKDVQQFEWSKMGQKMNIYLEDFTAKQKVVRKSF